MSIHSSLNNLFPIIDASLLLFDRQNNNELPFFERFLNPNSPEYLLAKELYRLGLIDTNGIDQSGQTFPALEQDDIAFINKFLDQPICFNACDGTPLLHTTLRAFFRDMGLEAKLVGGTVYYLLASYCKKALEALGATITSEIDKVFEPFRTLPKDIDSKLFISDPRLYTLHTAEQGLDDKSIEELSTLVKALREQFGTHTFEGSHSILEIVQTKENGEKEKLKASIISQIRVELSNTLKATLRPYRDRLVALLQKESQKSAQEILNGAFQELSHPKPECYQHIIITRLDAEVGQEGQKTSIDTVLVDTCSDHLFTRDALHLLLDTLQVESRVQTTPETSVARNNLQPLFDRLLKIVRTEKASIKKGTWAMMQLLKAKGNIVLGYPEDDPAELEKTALYWGQNEKLDVKELAKELMAALKNHWNDNPETIEHVAYHACESVTRFAGAPSGIELWNLLVKTSLPCQAPHPTFFANLLEIQPETAFTALKKYNVHLTASHIDALAKHCIQTDLAKKKPQAALNTLKQRFWKHLSQACNSSCFLAVTGHCFLHDKQMAYQLLKSEKAFETIDTNSLKDLEEQIAAHIDALQKSKDYKALLNFIKIPLIKQQFPATYNNAIQNLLESLEVDAKNRSQRIEVAGLALDTPEHFAPLLIPFLSALWHPTSSIPDTLKQKIAACQAVLCSKTAPVDLAETLTRHGIVVSAEVHQVIVTHASDLPNAQTALLPHVIAAACVVNLPRALIERYLPLCTLQQAITLLEAVAPTAPSAEMVSHWEFVQAKSWDEEEAQITILQRYGTYLLASDIKEFSHSIKWCHLETTRALALGLLARFRPNSNASWQAVFEAMQPCAKTSMKYSLYSLWKEESDNYNSAKVRTLAYTSLLESRNEELFDLIQRREPLLLPLSLLQAGIAVLKMKQTIPETSLQLLLDYRAEVGSDKAIDYDLIFCLLKSTTIAHQILALQIIREQQFARDTKLLNAVGTLLAQTFAPSKEVESLSFQLDEIRKSQPWLIPANKYFEFLSRNAAPAATCQELQRQFDAKTTDLSKPLLAAFLQKISIVTECKSELVALLTHPHCSTLLPAKVSASLWTNVLKTAISSKETFEAIVEGMQFFCQHYHRIPIKEHKVELELLDLAFKSCTLILSKFHDTIKFHRQSGSLMHVIARNFYERVEPEAEPRQKLPIAKVLSQIDDGLMIQELLSRAHDNSTTHEAQEKLDRINRLLLLNVLNATYDDPTALIYACRFVEQSMLWIMQICSPSGEVVVLFEKLIYFMPPSENEFYLAHLTRCFQLMNEAIPLQKFGQIDEALARKIGSYMVYLLNSPIHNAIDPAYQAKFKSVETIEQLLKEHIHAEHPFSIWRAIYLLETSSSLFMRDKAYKSFLACYEAIFAKASLVPFYRPDITELPRVLDLKNKHGSPSASNWEQKVLGDTEFDMIYRQLATRGHLPLIDLLIRMVRPKERATPQAQAMQTELLKYALGQVLIIVNKELEKETAASSWRAFILLCNTRDFFNAVSMQQQFVEAVLQTFHQSQKFLAHKPPLDQFFDVDNLKLGDAIDTEASTLLQFKNCTLLECFLQIVKASGMKIPQELQEQFPSLRPNDKESDTMDELCKQMDKMSL